MATREEAKAIKNNKVLITGASIAGPTLAYWLQRYGFDVTLLEKAPALRLGGQNIDVKGPAKTIAARMGLEEKIRAANTTEVGLQFVNTDNKVVAEFPKESSLSMTQELEILRGDLVNILYDHTKDKVRYLFGDHVIKVEQNDNEVSVSFASGETATFDLLIIAEGIGSYTRDLLLKDKTSFKFLQLYTAYFTIAKAPTDSRWARWCNAVKGIVYLLRPDNHGTTRACVIFREKEEKYNNLSLDEQKKILIQRIKNTGWESERLIKEIEQTDDFYFDRLSQVKLAEWSGGRVAVIGDAAYCATPISGKGTDLAMTGAYLLAGELATAQTHSEAFANYEKRMRPYVEKCQELPPGIPALVYPTSRVGVGLLNGVFRIVGSRPVKGLMALFSSKKKKKIVIELPDYG